MKILLENITKVLLENRVGDIKKKFPNVSPENIDYFVANDPSGNQKYLEWLVKALTHEPTMQSVEDLLDETMQLKSPQEFLMTLVKKFHELLPYMVYKDEVSGEKYGTTDLYQYKFTDSVMIHYLGNDLAEAKERKEKKEKEKSAKKNSDIIYNDGDWLVVRAKTWEASCVYGAGTKWCTTSKQTDSHFKRETDRNFLIYVINKRKTDNDPTYKVAWQIPYVKDMTKYVTGTPGNPEVLTLDVNKIKLWDAEDTNIANKGSSGYDYLDTVPTSVKTTILKYMQVQIDTMYENMAYVEDPYVQALVEYLTISEDNVDDIEEENWRHYNMKVFWYDSTHYAIGNEDDVESAKHIWAEQYIDDVGVAEAAGRNIERYITISDPNAIASDMADGYISDLSDEDVLDDAKRIGVKKSVVEEYDINQGIFETNQEEIDELMDRFDELDEEEKEYLNELEKENADLEIYNGKLFKSIKDALYDDYYNDYVERLENDPMDWLWEMGYYNKREGTLEKSAIQHGIVEYDESLLISDMVDDVGPDVLGDHGEVSIGNENYYIFEV